MAVAVLCNGPSRELYHNANKKYTQVLGCNIPWCNVDATVILDNEIAKHLAIRPELIKYKIYFGRRVWMYVDEIKKRPLFLKYFADLVDPEYPYCSSGHMAVQILINQGEKEIDIYGCDSYFIETVESWSDQYDMIPCKDGDHKSIIEWRKRWDRFIEKNPTVKLNFIRDTSEDIY
jgi:hypothetical protein